MHPRFGFGAGQAGGNDFPHVESDGPWSLEKTISGRQATAVDGNGNDGHFQHGVKPRSEEHTSELQSLMRISYAVFCLKKKTKRKNTQQLQKQKHTLRETTSIKSTRNTRNKKT